MTDEQKTLITWSSIYDNISEHPDCPPDYIINDDDVLDGWLIIQRRKREKDMNKQRAESLITNEKIKNSAEIFLPAGNVEDMKKIASLNDQYGDSVKRQRFKTINKRGIVEEKDMPDTRRELNMRKVQMFGEAVKKNVGG